GAGGTAGGPDDATRGVPAGLGDTAAVHLHSPVQHAQKLLGLRKAEDGLEVEPLEVQVDLGTPAVVLDGDVVGDSDRTLVGGGDRADGDHAVGVAGVVLDAAEETLVLGGGGTVHVADVLSVGLK